MKTKKRLRFLLIIYRKQNRQKIVLKNYFTFVGINTLVSLIYIFHKNLKNYRLLCFLPFIFLNHYLKHLDDFYHYQKYLNILYITIMFRPEFKILDGLFTFWVDLHKTAICKSPQLVPVFHYNSNHERRS